ncbi:MAG: hypothetical protein K8L99_04940 [Anaerolineae bacterium]|nr:hypothetical protein [Anaerolineae bacterium]
MTDKTTTEQPDPLENSLLHRLLVNTDRLQTLPVYIVVGVLLLNILLVAAVWWFTTYDGVAVALITVGYGLANTADWMGLHALRTTGRSFGPDKPTILALSALRALLLVALGLLPSPTWIALSLLALITLLVFYATWIEPFRLGVTHQQYVTSKWNADAPPLRLLQIGDIHMEGITPREVELNRLVETLKPDVIVFTGDFVNLSNTYNPDTEAAIREVISQWQAPLGVYCVSGTPLVEPMARVRAFVDGLDNLKLLPNQWITIQTPGGPLNILGLVVTHDMERDRAQLKKMMAIAPRSGLNLLLMHPPDIAPEANEQGIDLYLCGHTHGGQIRLPLIGALFSSSHLGNRFIMGRYELGTTTLYTSRGVGLEGLGAPRARFLCPPEIILWEIGGSA